MLIDICVIVSGLATAAGMVLAVLDDWDRRDEWPGHWFGFHTMLAVQAALAAAGCAAFARGLGWI